MITTTMILIIIIIIIIIVIIIINQTESTKNCIKQLTSCNTQAIRDILLGKSYLESAIYRAYWLAVQIITQHNSATQNYYS